MAREERDVLRRPRYDPRWWVGLGPFVLVTGWTVWPLATHAVTAAAWVFLYVVVFVAFAPAMLTLAYGMDDARRGYTYTRAVQGLFFMIVPWAFAVTSLVVVPVLVSADGALLLLALVLLCIGSVPALLYGAIQNHRNRHLPLCDPRGA